MAQVALNETPSEQLVKEAAKPLEITDPKGRTIKLVKPSVLSQFRLIKMVGADGAANMVYMNMIAPLTYIAEIDGNPVFFPKNEAELEAIIQRLDEDGVSAVQEAVFKHFGAMDPEAVKTAVGE